MPARADARMKQQQAAIAIGTPAREFPVSASNAVTASRMSILLELWTNGYLLSGRSIASLQNCEQLRTGTIDEDIMEEYTRAMSTSRFQSFLAGTIAVFLLAFSFNAYACVLPLSDISDASMANGCSTPVEQPSRQLCDAFKILGVESHAQSASLLVDHHWAADYALPTLPTANPRLVRTSILYCTLESSSPPHQSLASTVLRI